MKRNRTSTVPVNIFKPKRRFFDFSLPEMLLVAVIGFFSYEFFLIIYPYTSGALDIDFLQSKQAIIHRGYYQLAFYSHIFSSIPVLLAGAILFSKSLRIKFPQFHRQVGKGYVGLVLLVSAPSGAIMAMHANGGVWTKLAFLMAIVLWWWTTYQGLQTARRLDFGAHRRWMLRSYALSFSAVTLRVGQFFFAEIVDPNLLYLILSWASWIINLILAEWWILQSQPRLSPGHLLGA